MNHWERIDAAIAGIEVDHVPISLWRHFPEIDRNPEQLAAEAVNWQRKFDFDVVKFMPAGTYGVEDWGAQSAYLPSPIGTRTVVVHGVTKAEQWPRLAPLSPNRGRLGQELLALRLAAQALKGTVPILQTVFSPLTSAYKLAGDRLFADLRRSPALLEAGLEVIAKTTLDYARESLRAGAHGIFFATQCGTWRRLNEAEHRRFGVAFDRIVLDGLAGEARYVMVHLHGDDVMFDQLLAYPANMANWHDRHGELTLADGAGRFPGLVVGGLNERETLLNGSGAAIGEEIKDAIRQTGGRRIMIGPGCVVPITVSTEAIMSAIRACRGNFGDA